MTMSVLEKLCCRIPWCQQAILESTLELALEIAREGREGRRIGTLFTLGKADAVLATSRPLILDPLVGHAPARTHIADPDLRGTISAFFTCTQYAIMVLLARRRWRWPRRTRWICARAS